jgi:uncharacterized protein (TIGR03067 family)
MGQLLLIAASGLLLAAGQAIDQAKEKRTMTDHERIQGTWELVSGERNAKPFPDELIKHVTLIFSGNELTTKTKERSTKATFKLDQSKKPKVIDLHMDGEVGKGIYDLDQDILKIAHGEVGDARPSEFPKAGSGLTVLILKRKIQ